MTTAERAERQIIRLSHSGGQVVVEPDDEDRFVMTAQSAVRACQDSRQREEAIRVFKREFLAPLIQWCEQNTERVAACYIPVPQGHIQVFIVGKSSRFDFELGQQVAALELALADAGWRVCVLQLPASGAENLQTFFDTQGATEVYAQLPAAS